MLKTTSNPAIFLNFRHIFLSYFPIFYFSSFAAKHICGFWVYTTNVNICKTDFKEQSANRRGSDAKLGGEAWRENCDCNEIRAMKNIDIWREEEARKLLFLSHPPTWAVNILFIKLNRKGDKEKETMTVILWAYFCCYGSRGNFWRFDKLS